MTRPTLCVHFTGEDALAFVASGAAVDVMLLDIRMPGMSGTDVMQRLQHERALPPYPIFAVTGQVEADAQEQYRYALW